MALNFPNNPVDDDTWTDGNGVEWEFKGYGWKEIKIPTLASMTDVSGTPNVGDKLVWDGENWIPQFTQVSFSELTDVSGTPVTDDYMIYDGTDWVMKGSVSPPTFAKLSTTDGAYMTLDTWYWYIFNTEIFDTANMIDTLDKSKITITNDGLYTINCSFLMNNLNILSGGANYRMRLYIFPFSGPSYYNEDVGPGPWTYKKSGIFSLHKTLTLNMYVGDYIKVQLYLEKGIGGSPNDIEAKNVCLTCYKVSVDI